MNTGRYHLEQGCDDYERQDFKSAIRNFHLAARLGNTHAQVNLANMYDDGVGTVSNVKTATYYYKRAIQQGNSNGAYNLAVSYRRRGKLRWANYWLHRASVLGDEDATDAIANGGWQ